MFLILVQNYTWENLQLQKKNTHFTISCHAPADGHTFGHYPGTQLCLDHAF
jgi:hypothetical protein